MEKLNDPALLAAKERWFNRLSLFYKGGHDGRTFNLNGYPAVPVIADPYQNPELWVDESLDLLADQLADRFLDTGIFRPACIEYNIYGVHYVDKILGADVFMLEGGWNSRYLTTPVGALQAPDLDNNEVYLLSERAAKAFVASGVRLPLYGLPTIASALNIAVNLYGQNVFAAMYEEPECIMHDLRVINDLLIELHRRFKAIIPAENLQPVVSWERTQPYCCGQICGCSTQMISLDMYREFVAELDEALLAVYENGGMIHLCGTHTQHIPAFREMKSLNALQLHNRAAQDLAYYLEQLREDQVIYINTCAEMPYEQALEISRGRRVIFVGENRPVGIE